MSSLPTIAKTFTGVIIVALMIGCSDSGKKSSTNLIAATPSGGSCDFTAADGDRANFSVIGEEDIEIASFAKPFNATYLQAVLTTSIDESLKFIDRTGVNVFKVPSDKSGCDAIASASNLTVGLQSKWNALTVDDAKNDQFTLGVYLPKQSENIEALDDKAAILVRENTNRWTLVHEFMHHLFMIEQEKLGRTDETIRSNAMNDLNAFDALKQSLKIGSLQINLNSQDQKRLEEAFRKYAESFDIFITSFYLEEMTIEKRLHDLYSSGTFKFVPKYAYDSGIVYINSSAGKAKELYAMVKKDGDQLKSYKIAGSNLEFINVTDSSNLVQSRLNEMTLIINQYPLKSLVDLDSEQLRSRGRSYKKPLEKHTSCSRGKIADDFLQHMKNRESREKAKERLSLQAKPH